MNLVRKLATGLLLLTLAGCGASTGTSGQSATSSSVPAYVTEPFSHEQKLIEQGARLIVADGCSACHLMTGKSSLGPSFSSFAGHVVRLADGRRTLVNEAFLREGLLHPRAALLEGYDPAPMLAALARVHLDDRPHQVAALAAFIEQVGPEP
jgi:cytochrome c551/c552